MYISFQCRLLLDDGMYFILKITKYFQKVYMKFQAKYQIKLLKVKLKNHLYKCYLFYNIQN